MIKRSLIRLAHTLVVVLLMSAAAAGQESAARPQTKLVLQVEYLKGASPAYETVPGSTWYGRFGTLNVQRPAADTVLAVDIKASLEGERVRIKVGVHVGERQFDRLDEVATYDAAAGDTVVARELERVGVAPFTIRVLRVSETSAAPPLVVNKTRSIEAFISSFNATPLPRAKITLRNLSSKGVRAVQLRDILDGRVRLTRFVAEKEGKLLLGPGETYETAVANTTAGQSSGDGFIPSAPESVVVAAVVFDDYTYEGDAEVAAMKKSFDEGERVQLPRLIALVSESQAAPDAETPQAVARLKAQLSALDDASQSSVDAVLKSYPELKPAARESVRSSVEVSMHRPRRELLDDLAQFEEKFRSAPAENSFRAWLKAKRERYEVWLARL